MLKGYRGIVAGVVIGLCSAAFGAAAFGPLASLYGGGVPAAALLRVPVSGVYPGGVNLGPDIHNPLGGDPNAVERGMHAFNAFNCSGCHMANGGGGMGPALSNNRWVYRSSPANIYLTITQGRAKGMPAFGAMLPDRTVWELVAYVKSLSNAPDTTFGSTTAAAPPSPDKEQVSANQEQTATPWKFTEPIRNGQSPH
jgi:cytochrome c oxidase cbb3-type subunit 3